VIRICRIATNPAMQFVLQYIFGVCAPLSGVMLGPKISFRHGGASNLKRDQMILFIVAGNMVSGVASAR
jgi:hypothetical protein